MSFFRRLFGGQDASQSPSGTQAYFSKEWNFGLTLPSDWETLDQPESNLGWTRLLRVAGPRVARERAYLSVNISAVLEDDKNLQKYMDKVESDLRRAFPDFKPDTRQERTLLGQPLAWMTYSYRLEGGQRKEVNATMFLGRKEMILLQFVGETEAERWTEDLRRFESVIESLKFGGIGVLRYPNLTFHGVPACELCDTSTPDGKYESVLILQVNRLAPVCRGCCARLTAAYPLARAAPLRQAA